MEKACDFQVNPLDRWKMDTFLRDIIPQTFAEEWSVGTLSKA